MDWHQISDSWYMCLRADVYYKNGKWRVGFVAKMNEEDYTFDSAGKAINYANKILLEIYSKQPV
jgi:hypothetical protein